MSFYSEDCGRYKIVYGYDHRRGYFLRIFDRQIEPANIPILERPTDGNDKPTYHEIVKLARKYGARKVKLNL